MTEATGYEAQTIHRMLELTGMPEDDREGQPVHFERNAENPLEADVIIIDEMSDGGYPSDAFSSDGSDCRNKTDSGR